MDDKNQNGSLAEELERARREAGLSQRALTRDLGISQGHYSKVISGKVPDKKRYVDRGLALLAPTPGARPEIDGLVAAAAQEIRASAAFRRLIEAALGYSVAMQSDAS